MARLFFVLCFLMFDLSPAHALTSLNSITIMADSAMSLPIAQLARNYSREHQIAVSTSFIPAKLQEAQITEGAAADILITPQQSWIDKLKTRGLVDIYSEVPVARGRLALVGPADSKMVADMPRVFPTSALIAQMDGNPGFVVGNPESLSEGIYGKQALRAIDAADDLEPYTLYIKDQSQMLDMVTQHQAYGLFFYANVINRPGMRVIGVLPDNSHKPINYFAVVIAGDNMDEARKFLAYMATPAAKKVLREGGFSTD